MSQASYRAEGLSAGEFSPLKSSTGVKSLRILRLDMSMDQTSGPYMQFSLPVADVHQITVLSYVDPAEKISPRIEFHSYSSSAKKYVKAIIKHLRERPFDVVHAHSVHVAFAYLLARLFLPFRKTPPTVLTMHCSWPNLKFRNRIFALFPFTFFDRVIFCSKSSEESFPRILRAILGKRGKAICNGVDIVKLDSVLSQINERSESNRMYFRIVTVGRLEPVKDQLTLLRAFALLQHSDAQLVIVGEGSLKQEIVAEAQRLGISSRIQIIDFLKRVEVYELLSDSDLFVSTSLTEGMPIAPLESMLCGCPVVLSDIPSHREILDGDPRFEIVEPGDAAGFAAAIEKMIGLSRGEKSDLRRFSRALVEERFALSRMLSAYEQVFTSAISEKAGAL